MPEKQPVIERLSNVTLTELSERFNAQYAQHRGGQHEH